MAAPAGPTMFSLLAAAAWKGEQLTLPRDAKGNRATIQEEDISDLMRGMFRPGVAAPGGGTPPVLALRIKDAEITGTLNLSGRREKPFPPLEFEDCIFKEEICLRCAWMSWLSFTNCRMVHLQADGCKIDGSLVLDRIESSANRTTLSGSTAAPADSAGHPTNSHPGAAGLGLCWIELRNATIVGDFKAKSCKFCAPPARRNFNKAQDRPEFALDLQGMDLRGSLTTEPDLLAVGGMSITNAHIAGNVWGRGAELLAVEGDAFSAQNCHIGANLVLSHHEKQTKMPFRTIGCVRLFGGKIGGIVRMDGAFIQPNETEPTAIMAPYIKVDDYVHIAGSVAGPIFLENAHIGADCTLDLSVVGDLFGGTTPRLVDFKNASVEGSFNIQDLKFNDPIRRWSDPREVLEIVQARSRKLRCYAGWHLVEIRRKTTRGTDSESEIVTLLWEEKTVNLLWDGKDEAIPLDGFSARFRDLNKRIGVLGLKDTADAEEYLRLFASNINGQNGPFFILAGVEEAGPLLRDHLDRRPRAIETRDLNDKVFEIEADVVYASNLFRARFHVTKKDGIVQMVADDLIPPELILISTYFDAPFRIDLDQARKLPSLFTLQDWEAMEAKKAGALLKTAEECPTPVQEDTRAQFDLTGAAVKRLEDADGEAVGRSVRLRLEGFRYQQMGQTSSPFSLSRSFRQTVEVYEKKPLLYALLVLLGALKLIGGIIRLLLAPLFEIIRTVWKFLQKPRQLIVRGYFSIVADKFLVSRNEKKKLPPWQKRLNWLALQYPSYKDFYRHVFYAVESSGFLPQPYDQVAAVLRSQGQFEDSRKILSHKLTLERHFKPHALLRCGWWLYWLGFDYGLSAGRALVTLLLFLSVGAIAAGYANARGLLVAEAPARQASLDTGRPTEIPCGERKSTTLYAAEEFIPVADLKLEPKCHIRTFDSTRDAPATASSFASRFRKAANGPVGWRIGEVVYRILGWIILSLCILTFTGVARRHLEK